MKKNNNLLECKRTVYLMVRRDCGNMVTRRTKFDGAKRLRKYGN